jgi:3-methyladenine DNA glycosylase AlkD
MAIIHSKKEAVNLCLPFVTCYHDYGLKEAVEVLQQQLLVKKVKFPALEAAAHFIASQIPSSEQLFLCEQIMNLHTIGGNVIVGILLQKRLEQSLFETLKIAAQFIIKESVWYACDIIGERVWGVALLTYPNEVLPFLATIKPTDDIWLVRLIGIAGHYAIKKGLSFEADEVLFQLILNHQNHKSILVKKAIAWSAKTTKRCHPGIPIHYQHLWGKQNGGSVWFASALK